jgi:hypothetical protein
MVNTTFQIPNESGLVLGFSLVNIALHFLHFFLAGFFLGECVFNVLGDFLERLQHFNSDHDHGKNEY